MPLLRNLLLGFAFLLGCLCLLGLIQGLAIAFSESSTLRLLSPLLIGLAIALVTARSVVAGQWWKGPALLLAAATFASLSMDAMELFDRQQRQADSWFDVLLGIAFSLCWILLTWLLTNAVYRSSNRILFAIGRALMQPLRRNARDKAHRS